jgi:hypothetical protein
VVRGTVCRAGCHDADARYAGVMLFHLALALSAALAVQPASAKLSSAEQTIVRTVDAEHARTVDMLGKWVA